jgi:hypothetical protein
VEDLEGKKTEAEAGAKENTPRKPSKEQEDKIKDCT